MKKLMIAAAIVCVAAVSQAATMYNWQSGPIIEYGATDPDKASWVGGTYYLIQGDATVQETMVNAILAAGSDYATEFGKQVAGAINSAVYSTETYTLGNAAQGKWSDDVGGIVWDMTDTKSLPFYQMILDTANDAFYVSEVAYSDYTNVGASAIGLYNTGFDTFEDAEKYISEGWYGVDTTGGGGSEGVPEPTSGLLMLVGLAGLALRRKLA